MYGSSPAASCEYADVQTDCLSSLLPACAQVLSETEVDWVNTYHREVWDKVSPRLSGDVLEWLRTNTAPLAVPAAKQQVAAMA